MHQFILELLHSTFVWFMCIWIVLTVIWARHCHMNKARVYTSELNKVILKIKSFRLLKDNWDGNDAKPFSHQLINKALIFALELNVTPKVFPTSRDSIQFEWETKEGLYLEIEIYESRIEIYNQMERNNQIIAQIGDNI